MGSAIWCLRTPPLGSSESLGPWLLGHQLPGRESREEARCPPTCLPPQLERLFTKTFPFINYLAWYYYTTSNIVQPYSPRVRQSCGRCPVPSPPRTLASAMGRPGVPHSR